MPQLFLNIFSDQLIPAITWTLIHSVWEGLIFAFSAGIIIVITNKSKAAKRYNLLALNLITFLLVVTITCCYEVNIKPDITISYVQPLKENVHINLQLTNSEQIEKISNYLTAYIDSNAYIIVFVWSSAMLFKCLLLLIGLQKLHMLKTEKIHIVNEFWNKKFRELSGKLQLRKHVQLLQSGIAKVPMVIGHLKPVVLIPFGLLTALTQEEAEAILLHELAHIKRNDYLINLLQTFIQTIFFFNPAVLWMSSMLRNERENCCDDIAVTYLRNKTNYVNALVAFQEYNLKIEGLTTAFPGKRYHLLQRVKRIIYNHNQTLTSMQKIVLLSCVSVIFIIGIGFSQGKNLAPQNKNETQIIKAQDSSIQINTGDKSIAQINDTVPSLVNSPVQDSSTFQITTTYNGKEYKIICRSNVVKELYIDGQKIPDEKINNYKSVTDKIIQDTKENEKKLKQQTVELEKRKEELYKEQLAMEDQMKNLKQREDASQEMQEIKAKLDKANVAAMQELQKMKLDQTQKDEETSQRLQKIKEDFEQQQREYQEKIEKMNKEQLEDFIKQQQQEKNSKQQENKQDDLEKMKSAELKAQKDAATQIAKMKLDYIERERQMEIGMQKMKLDYLQRQQEYQKQLQKINKEQLQELKKQILQEKLQNKQSDSTHVK